MQAIVPDRKHQLEPRERLRAECRLRHEEGLRAEAEQEKFRRERVERWTFAAVVAVLLAAGAVVLWVVVSFPADRELHYWPTLLQWLP